MTNSRHHPVPSRAGSSRPESAARTIVQKRDKQWRAETAQVYEKKRKLRLHTWYANADAPLGYRFVPYGTPILSDLCKELSRQQGQAVYIVNEVPQSRGATDPDKISHHMHRLGYHFKATLVADACEELGYIPYRGKFVKEEDIAKKNTDSQIAKIMARHGLSGAAIQNQEERETKDQLRTAVKELFPNIPDVDMEEVIDHAWEDGSLRIGTMRDKPLPERIQYAIGARIRHEYTDYDILLKEFNWSVARQQCEQACLAKIKEWRGEELQDDVEEREWIMREYIVIDDDDDVDATQGRANGGHEADDEGSETEQGHTSDSSIEITHYQAREEDLGAESSHETARRPTARAQQPKPHSRPAILLQPHSYSHNPPQSNPSQSLSHFPRQQTHQQATMSSVARDYYQPDQFNTPYAPPQQMATTMGAHRPFQPPAYDIGYARAGGSPYQRPSSDYAYGRSEQRLATERSDLALMQALPPNQRNAATEMVVDGVTYQRMPDNPVPTNRRLFDPARPYVYEPPPAQPVRVPNYEPYGHPLPSIEPNGSETQHEARPGIPPPSMRAQTPPRPFVEYIDLTSPGRPYARLPQPLHGPIDLTSPARRSAQPPQPIHGAPAPVQQAPREGHHSRNASNSYPELTRY